MNGENVFTILERNRMVFGSINLKLYDEISQIMNNEQDIVKKIKGYNENKKNNKYSDQIIQYLRQKNGLDKFYFSNDEELCNLSENEVFEDVLKWN